MQYIPFLHLINPLAIEVCKILNENEYQAFIVGGCIRDLILGDKPKDYDIATDATPNQVIKLFKKTIPTGLQHGTVTVCMDEGKNNHFEVTTFRIESEYKDGRRPEEVFFVMNIEQDLARRDLTINAIAYDPINHKIIDPFKGIDDLKNFLIRAVGNPSVRFKEDGLRIMRVARFAAKFGYDIDYNTFAGMSKNLGTLKQVSKERIKDELCKILMSKYSSYGLQILLKSGALNIICPLLNNYPINNLLHQDKCQGDLETKLAFLYNKFPPIDVQKELFNLKFSNKEIKKTTFLLELLERFNIFKNKDTAYAYKSFIALVKNHAIDSWEDTLNQFIRLAEALNLPVNELLLKYKNEIVFSRKEMQLNGDDLINIGIPIGPRIKECLDQCYLEILRHPEFNNKYHLLDYSRKF